MSKQVHDIIARGDARVVGVPKSDSKTAARHQIEVDRNFELPTGLFGATAGLYLAFIAVMAAAFGNPVLVIPLVIIALLIVVAFGVPSVWTRMKSNGLETNETRPMTLGKFGNDGIMTHTGRCAPRDAAVQVLILPVLVVLWGLAAAFIAALV